MNDFEGKSEGVSLDDLRALRLFVAAAILLMCIFIGCMDVASVRTAISLGRQVDAEQKTWDAYEKNEQKNDQARANFLFSSLNEYARTHPDFQPIMQAINSNLSVSPGPEKKK